MVSYPTLWHTGIRGIPSTFDGLSVYTETICSKGPLWQLTLLMTPGCSERSPIYGELDVCTEKFVAKRAGDEANWRGRNVLC